MLHHNKNACLFTVPIHNLWWASPCCQVGQLGSRQSSGSHYRCGQPWVDESRVVGLTKGRLKVLKSWNIKATDKAIESNPTITITHQVMISSSSDSRWVFHSTDSKIHILLYISGAVCQATEYPRWYGSIACPAVGRASGLMWCILGPSAYMLWILSKLMNHDITYVQHIHHRSAKCGTLFLIVWSDGW